MVGPRVFAVGSDARFVVAKQYPSGDQTVTNYFMLDKRRTNVRSLESAIIGPLTESEFRAKAIDLALPPFTRVLESRE